MPQGRDALYRLIAGEASWPPVVVPFGLDPFGWHGVQPSYREVCAFALERCTLLPKVLPFTSPLMTGRGDCAAQITEQGEHNGSVVRRFEIPTSGMPLWSEMVRTPGDTSWKTRSRWIESKEDISRFLGLTGLTGEAPDIDAVRVKESAVGEYGLPYVEVVDPFYMVSEMMPTDFFYITLREDTKLVTALIDQTAERILDCIEVLCRDAGCPFILRLIGAEMAVPPFMSRDDFLRFEGDFYLEAHRLTARHGIPAAFHCHGPVRDIMNDVWEMGYEFFEVFEPPPRGNVTIAEALEAAQGRGIVFGGVDEVLFNTGSTDEVRDAVMRCLDDARPTRRPYILSQSATPFHDPLSPQARDNLLLFMELGVNGA